MELLRELNSGSAWGQGVQDEDDDDEEDDWGLDDITGGLDAGGAACCVGLMRRRGVCRSGWSGMHWVWSCGVRVGDDGTMEGYDLLGDC